MYGKFLLVWNCVSIHAQIDVNGRCGILTYVQIKSVAESTVRVILSVFWLSVSYKNNSSAQQRRRKTDRWRVTRKHVVHDGYIFPGCDRITTGDINHVLTLRDCHDQQTPERSPSAAASSISNFFAPSASSALRLAAMDGRRSYWFRFAGGGRCDQSLYVGDQPSTHCTCVYYRLKRGVNSKAARRNERRQLVDGTASRGRI